MKNIVLTGFMASGKSTIGRELSAISGMEFVDTDELVEKSEGITINEIFARFGEEYFRDRESAAVAMAAEKSGAVIATGGGAVLRHENIELLRKNGVVFNLEPSAAVICERLNGARASRPLLAGEELEAVLERFRKRQPYYDNCDCKIYVSNSRTPREFAVEILEHMKSI